MLKIQIPIIISFLTVNLLYAQEKETNNLFGLTEEIIRKKMKVERYSMDDITPKVVRLKEWEFSKPIVILDENLVSSEIFRTLNAGSIEFVSQDNRPLSYNGRCYNGQLSFKLKGNNKVKLISLNELVSKFTKLKNKDFIFSIDGEVLDVDPDLKVINELMLMQVKIVEFNYFDIDQNLVHIKMLSRTPNNVKNANEIILR